MTILLSLTVFLNLVAETLPQVSDAIPLLGSRRSYLLQSLSIIIVFVHFFSSIKNVFRNLNKNDYELFVFPLIYRIILNQYISYSNNKYSYNDLLLHTTYKYNERIIVLSTTVVLPAFSSIYISLFYIAIILFVRNLNTLLCISIHFILSIFLFRFLYLYPRFDISFLVF